MLQLPQPVMGEQTSGSLGSPNLVKSIFFSSPFSQSFTKIEDNIS